MDYPITPAIRLLRAKNIAFEPHLYDYEERGGTRRSAEMLGVDEHAVIKTLVMENELKKPLIVLMHGDREVSTKSLARTLGAKSIKACDPAAQKHTGYLNSSVSFLCVSLWLGKTYLNTEKHREKTQRVTEREKR